MRISDWSSDVCSSDLYGRRKEVEPARCTWQGVGPWASRMGAALFKRFRLECHIERGLPDRRLLHRQARSFHATAGNGPHELPCGGAGDCGPRRLVCRAGDDRSEEHTSELQSLMRISYAVSC